MKVALTSQNGSLKMFRNKLCTMPSIYVLSCNSYNMLHISKCLRFCSVSLTLPLSLSIFQEAFVELYDRQRDSVFCSWPSIKTVFGLAALGAASLTIGAYLTQKWRSPPPSLFLFLLPPALTPFSFQRPPPRSPTCLSSKLLSPFSKKPPSSSLKKQTQIKQQQEMESLPTQKRICHESRAI